MMKVSTFGCLFIVSIFFAACNTSTEKKESHSIQITEQEYKNTPHFKITTPGATYFYEKMSGGFSSIFDQENNDWVAFSKSDTVVGPKSADSDFRGIPNMVFRGEQNGIGHPGFDMCTSVLLNDSTIFTTSNDSMYQYTWTFSKDKAVMNIQKVDTSRSYWILYEGPIGGSFNPATHFCYTNTGYQPRKPSIFEGNPIQGKFEWFCFGDSSSNYLFYFHHNTPDTLVDIMTYMGNSDLGNVAVDGMVVMGFGRTPDTQPLMNTADQVFTIGFLPYKPFQPDEMMDYIAKELED